MNIVFWSPLCGHGATTSNLTCMAIMSSLLYSYRTVSFQSGFSNNYLDQTFLGERSNQAFVREEFTCYADKGIDGVMSSMALNTFVCEEMEDYLVEIVKGLNYYIPSTKRSNEAVFTERMATSLPKLLESCGREFDITFVDHQGSQGRISDLLFENADLCVINLNQNPELIHYAREQFEKVNCGSKVMYIIGRYDESNHYTVKNIAGKFNISKSDIGVIPYNSEFMDAVLSGRTKEFLKENLRCSRRSFNYNFMCEVRELTGKLLTKAGMINV
ncbi:MAG: hypothetical protein PUE71_01195 [Clostridia bacterium]|nr:hypothetical protein [Clostridia bacterium]